MYCHLAQFCPVPYMQYDEMQKFIFFVCNSFAAYDIISFDNKYSL